MNYRPEIDGLRALAVLSVIFFHAGFSGFSGGFVGVDVFFVISGFLISSKIDFQTKLGKFSLSQFYESRARRILPALFFVLFLSWILATIWLTPTRMIQFSKAVLAAIFMVPNLYFWKSSGYWEQESGLNPLIHLWSLGVEEQFYLLFPCFFIFWMRLPKNIRWLGLSFVLLSSLFLGEWGSRFHPDFAFYQMPLRAWEFLAGMFLLGESRPIESRFRNALSFLGMFLVCFAVVRFDSSWKTSGFYGLIPVIGTMLLIKYSDQSTWLGAALSLKPLRYLGLISYSAYLLHQPIFAFARLYFLAPITAEGYLLLIIVILVLSFFVWYYVENPFRTTVSFLKPSTATVVLLMCLGAYGVSSNGIAARFPVSKALELSLKIYQDKCLDLDGHNLNTCKINPSSTADGDFLVIGDSHGVALFPGFYRAAQSSNRNGFMIVQRALPMVVQNSALSTKITHLMDYHEIRQVFLVSRWSARVRTQDCDDFAQALARTIEFFKEKGVKIFLIEQVPEQLFDVSELYRRGLAGLSEVYSVPFSKHLERQRSMRQVFKRFDYSGAIETVNFDGIFCDLKLCRMGESDFSYYADQNHLSILGALKTVPLLTEILKNHSS